MVRPDRSSTLNSIYSHLTTANTVTDYNTLTRVTRPLVYVKSPYRTPRDYITLVRDRGRYTWIVALRALKSVLGVLGQEK